MGIIYKGTRSKRIGKLITIPHGRIRRKAKIESAKKEVPGPRTVYERR